MTTRIQRAHAPLDWIRQRIVRSQRRNFLEQLQSKSQFRDSPFGKKRPAVSLDATVLLASNRIQLRTDPTDGAGFAILRNASSVAVGHDSNRCHYNRTALPVPAAS